MIRLLWINLKVEAAEVVKSIGLDATVLGVAVIISAIGYGLYHTFF